MTQSYDEFFREQARREGFTEDEAAFAVQNTPERKLLRKALMALNSIPRHDLPALETDSYELAAEIGHYLRSVGG